MPQQLIYTSAPRGVIAGRSGHCTVARSTAMRDALMLQLEKLSYYQHLSLSGGQERPIYCCRSLDIRGSRYHVLSRIRDAGLDFTGRTNFIAHHLVFAPEEVRKFALPPIILRDWPGWVDSWNKEPELFGTENWSSLESLSGRLSVPAMQWQKISGDAVNGYGLLETRAGTTFQVDGLTDQQVLTLFAEALELLDLRDPRRDFRASAWQYTFTTSMQEQDNPADFRWRCLHSDNPAANRFAGPDCRALSEVRASRVTNEEALFARAGRQPPRFVSPPQNVNSVAGENARFRAKAKGVPTPAYQWFTVDRAGKRNAIPGATSEELVVPNPPLGVTRYAVLASNSQGEILSEVVTLSVEQTARATPAHPAQTQSPIKPAEAPHIKSQEEIERQRQRLEAEKTKKPASKWPFFLVGFLLLIAASATVAIQYRNSKKTAPIAVVQRHDTNTVMSNVQHMTNIVVKETPAEPSNTTAETAVVEHSNRSLLADLPPAAQLVWPAKWSRQPVGAVSYHHADCITNSPVRFVLSAAAEGLRAAGDSLFFVCRTNVGTNFQASIIANAADYPLPPRSARGIMVRDSDSPTSSLLFIGASPNQILACRREAKGAFIFTNAFLPQLPVILKFEQQENQITAAYSFDHRTWTSFAGYEFPAKPQSLVGFAAWSGDPTNRVIARFVLLSSGEAMN